MIIINDKIPPSLSSFSWQFLVIVRVWSQSGLEFFCLSLSTLCINWGHIINVMYRIIQHNTKGHCDNGSFPLGKERGNSLHQTDHKQSKRELKRFTTRVKIKTNFKNNIFLFSPSWELMTVQINFFFLKETIYIPWAESHSGTTLLSCICRAQP